MVIVSLRTTSKLLRSCFPRDFYNKATTIIAAPAGIPYSQTFVGTEIKPVVNLSYVMDIYHSLTSVSLLEQNSFPSSFSNTNLQSFRSISKDR